jgi:hypothetical protein
MQSVAAPSSTRENHPPRLCRPIVPTSFVPGVPLVLREVISAHEISTLNNLPARESNFKTTI